MNDEEFYVCQSCGHEAHADKFGKYCPSCGTDFDDLDAELQSVSMSNEV